jgi:hypothetical protein
MNFLKTQHTDIIKLVEGFAKYRKDFDKCQGDELLLGQEYSYYRALSETYAAILTRFFQDSNGSYNILQKFIQEGNCHEMLEIEYSASQRMESAPVRH